jgi:hypothetical protein
VSAAAVAIASLAVVQFTGLLPPEGATRASGSSPAAALVRHDVALWVHQQVSRSAIIACDPAMCAALRGEGIAAGNLLALGTGTTDPLGSDVVIASSAVRGMFGARLARVYAPDIIATFGTGTARVEVRATASEGSAAYRHALAADLALRQQYGSALLGNVALHMSGAARAELAAGAVDSRLLSTLAALSRVHPVRILSFGPVPPGASPDQPLRTAVVTSSGSVSSLLSFLHAQRPPYRITSDEVIREPHGSAVSFTFGSPSPLGLLHTGGLPQT